jgi:iron complex transport system permease protein
MKVFSEAYQSKQKQYRLITIILWMLTPVFFILDISVGSIDIPFSKILRVITGDEITPEVWKIIIRDTRLPQAIIAVAAGMGLSLSGLLMQIYFRNPLAGPSVLGVSSGASLMVLVVMTVAGSANFIKQADFLSSSIIYIAAITGALTVLFLLLLLVRILHNYTILLIAGLMLSYLVSSVESIILQFSNAEQIQRFVNWGMGSFSGHTLHSSLYLIMFCMILFTIVLSMIKKIDLYNQGEEFAKTMGINMQQITYAMLLISGCFTALITAYCGPVAFLGMAVPHLTRLMVKTDKHIIFIPAVAATGILLALLCSTISRSMLAGITLPLNAVTSIIGASVVLWLLFRKK